MEFWGGWVWASHLELSGWAWRSPHPGNEDGARSQLQVVSWEPSAEHFQEEGGSGQPGQVLPRGQACTLAVELWHRVCAVSGVPCAPELR